MTDPVSDLLTRVRNAQRANKATVSMPASKLKVAILNVLKEEGYIGNFESSENGGKPVVSVTLKYYQGAPVIETIKRVSRPSLRIYRGKDELPSVNGGLGTAIISTSRGVMSDREARKSGHGGEVLCFVS
ncbi:ribosomal protein S8 [gamma proteobacterium HTCC5015]|nr:ribosomal protein S8 [gamma proteobacterium HTCC5015]